jgi:hypothetical protein
MSNVPAFTIRADCVAVYADKSPSAVKRSFSDLDIDDHLPPPPPCLPPSVHHHPCRPRAAHSPPSSEQSVTSLDSAAGGCSSTCVAAGSHSKCPRLDGECSSPGGASCGGLYTSVAEADSTRKCAATQTWAKYTAVLLYLFGMLRDGGFRC